MQPVVAVGVVGHARVVVETDNSGGDGVESAKGVQELVGGAGGAAIQVGEVLGDVDIAACLEERQEGSKFAGSGDGSTGYTNDELVMLKEPKNTRYVGQAFVGHAQ
jgi:hypothetical protein